MSVKSIMTRKLITVGMDDSVRTVQRLFDVHGFHHLLVVERSRLIGVISDRDLLKNLSPFIGSKMERVEDAHLLERRVHQIMRRRPVTVTPDADACDAAQVMLEHKVSCLPVVAVGSERPVGILTWRDILRSVCPAPLTPAEATLG
jgi:acetoin utilization protein AcuB